MSLVKYFKLLVFLISAVFTDVSYSQSILFNQSLNVIDSGFIFFTAPHDNILFIPSKFSKIDDLFQLYSIWGIQIHLSEITLETDKLLNKFESPYQIHLEYVNRRKTTVSYWRVLLQFEIPISEFNCTSIRCPLNILREHQRLKVCFFTKSISNYYDNGHILKLLE